MPLLDNPNIHITMHKCNNSSIHYLAYRLIGHSTVQVKRIYCNKWSCSYCCRKRSDFLSNRIFSESKKFKLNKSVTLTSAHDVSPPKSYKLIKDGWKKFRQAMSRSYKKEFKYIWTTEFDKKGYPHFHVLTNKFIKQKKLSNTWQKYSGAKIVHIKKVGDADCDISRIAEYMIKDLSDHKHKRRKRRYGYSKCINLKIPAIEENWEIVPDLNDLDSLFRTHRIVYRKFDDKNKKKLVYCRALKRVLHKSSPEIMRSNIRRLYNG